MTSPAPVPASGFSSRAAAAAASLASALADAAFPPRCAACGALADPSVHRGFCRSCLSRLPLRPARDRWLRALDGPPPPGDPLPDLRAVAACFYRDPIREILLQLKFHEQGSLAEALGLLIADAVRRVAAERAAGGAPAWDAVAAVPLHAARLRERGYNQAELVARTAARALGLDDLSGALARTRATRVQSLSESPEARRENLRGAFAATDPAAVRGRRILLVDDVLTTGATIHAGALALREAGAADVAGAVVAATRRSLGEVGEGSA